MHRFPHLMKMAAIQAKPDLSVKPPQPIKPLTDPSQASSPEGAAVAQAGPGGAFPSGPQSLHAGEPDQSAAMAEQAKLQETQIKEQERQHKVQQDLHKAQTELVQTKAENVAAKAQQEAAAAREQLVTDKEKALDHHTKMIEKARKLESRPTLLSASADRISKKIEGMGSNLKFAHLAFIKVALAPGAGMPTKTPAPAPAAPNPPPANMPPTPAPSAQPTAPPAPAAPQAPVAPPTTGAPTAPAATTPPATVQPWNMSADQLNKVMPGLQRMAPNTFNQVLSGQKTVDQAKGVLDSQQQTRGQMQENQVNIDYLRSGAGRTAEGISGFINSDPDYYRNRKGFLGGNHFWNNAADNRLNYLQGAGRELWNGGEDYGKGNVTGMLSHIGNFTGGVMNNVVLPAATVGGLASMTGLGSTAMGASRALPRLLGRGAVTTGMPWLARAGIGAANTAGEMIAPHVGAPLNALNNAVQDPNTDELENPAQNTRNWQVGSAHLTASQEAQQAARANGTPGADGSLPYTSNGQDMSALNRTGYFHQDAFSPTENWRSQFSNPYWQTGVHTLGPMLYPGVNMSQYNGEQGGFDPMGRMRSLAPMMFPMLQQNYMR